MKHNIKILLHFESKSIYVSPFVKYWRARQRWTIYNNVSKSFAHNGPYFELEAQEFAFIIVVTVRNVDQAMIFHLHNCRWLNTKRIGPWLINPPLVCYRDINPLLTGMRKEKRKSIPAHGSKLRQQMNHDRAWMIFFPYLNKLSLISRSW